MPAEDPKTIEEARAAMACMFGTTLREQFLPGFAAMCEAAKPADRGAAQLMLKAAREIVEGLEAGRVPGLAIEDGAQK